MTRRLNYTTNPDFEPWLNLALFGALLIACGVGCQLLQIVVSVIKRNELKDETGDPWNGHTLEWSTSSPAPFYNFAKLPLVHDIGRPHRHEGKGRGLRLSGGGLRHQPVVAEDGADRL